MVPGIGSRNVPPRSPPRRLLLANAGHLGDLIITTALLPVLHHVYPGIEIGILTGSHSRSVVDGHPLIARTHYLDHWYLRRDSASGLRKLARYYLADRGNMVRELGASGYDTAIDVRAWFPNFVTVLWQAKIPTRIGFDRVGFGPLLTVPMKFRYERRHELEYQLELLQAIGARPSSFLLAHPSLPPVTPGAAAEAVALVGDAKRYHVLHMAAGTATRDWPNEHWRELAQSLTARGVVPVLTGRGPRDAAMTAHVARAVPGCIDACDRLSWGGLVALIAGAELVYSVDTSVGHVAAALKRPVVAIYGGMSDPYHWKPYGDTAMVATNLVHCHPCFMKNGCPGRECLTDLETRSVISIANQLAEKVDSTRQSTGL